MSKQRSYIACLLAATAATGMAVSVGVVGLSSAFELNQLPYDLAVLRLRQPIAFPLHMATGSLALMLLVVVIAVRRRPRLHRPLGYFAGSLLAVAAVTALPSAISSVAAPWARAGFMAQSVVCLSALAAGWWLARQGRLGPHRIAMSVAIATASGVVLLRAMLLGIDWLDMPFEPSYAGAAWLSWVLPLAAFASWHRRPVR